MIDTIKTFLSELAGGTEKRDLRKDEFRLAAAALLFHVIAVDGIVSPQEREKLSALLSRQFDLGKNDAAELATAAETADNEAIDLYAFTSILVQRLEAPDRERIVEMMWELVYADGTVHEFEDNVIWRVAELLGVSTQARMSLKLRVRDGFGR
jgi:uncharacterized tellurite resistance protein B-like protein